MASSPDIPVNNWRFEIDGSLSPLKDDEINIYSNLRTIVGPNVIGIPIFLTTGVVTSFSKSEVFPDLFEFINLPERGIYLRLENRSLWNGSGTFNESSTDIFGGWSDTWFPFSFAIEFGPRITQRLPCNNQADLRASISAFLNIKYNISGKSEIFLDYRPTIGIGGSGDASQLLNVGIGYKF